MSPFSKIHIVVVYTEKTTVSFPK